MRTALVAFAPVPESKGAPPDGRLIDAA